MKPSSLISSHSFIAILVMLCTLMFCQSVVFSVAQENRKDTDIDKSSGAGVDTLLAGLSDVQVRQMLLAELKKEAAHTESPENQNIGSTSEIFGDMLGALSSQTDYSERRLQRLWKKIPNIFPDLYKVFLALCPLGTSTFQGAMTNFILVLLFVSIGLIVELLMKKYVLGKYFKLDTNVLDEMSNSNKFFASITKKLPDFIGLFFFFGASYFSFFAFAGISSPLVQLFFLAILLTISLIRVVSMCLRIPLSPSVPSFRILPLEDEPAKFIHRVLMWTFGYIIAVVMFGTVIHRLGAELQTVQLMQLFFATLLLAFTGIGVLYFKNRVKEHIISDMETQTAEHGWGRQQFAAVWHVIAILYLVILWILLVSSIADPDPDRTSKGAFLLSFFVVPLWLIADRVVHLVVIYAMSTLNIYQFDYEEESEVEEDILAARENGKRLYLKIEFIARAGLIFALLVWIASLWNIKIPLISNLAGVLLDGFIIMALALLVWKFISSWIERKIQDSIPEGEEEKKEDDGGEFGSSPTRGRSYTLLPMVRKFIGTVLVVMVSMTILSSMGVDIGPLLAGAGVIGLAVGFGAQKLVADMFSGFFYLMDDAFRVGEYLTAGSVGGTVESISLRNLMLRHHRGMLQIVPHSQLGAITNFMRGGMVVKFNLDFPYDADIDLIRRIIKKIGQAMLEDEEFGSDFIQPVKSQGVREITNSVMTIRVKFTAKPGTHFVIRREAYKRITETLAAKGIHYAHKKVIVDVPGLSEARSDNRLSEKQVATIANSVGAAGLASINEDEEQAAAAQKAGKSGPDIPV
jgi:small-conductance mechanosensitive channel